MVGEQIMQAMTTIQEVASVKQVFGEPKTVGDRTVIPVAAVSYGFGFGYGRGTERTDGQTTPAREGGGGGGGGQVRARPVAVLEITPEGTRVEPIVDVSRIALAGIALGAWSVFWVSATIRKVARARGARPA
ncbi:MAG: hypothetical protein HY334_04695 [Armatimonadetes bacterium]|nr:hypothetical protein [Armatimonadota bacterium]